MLYTPLRLKKHEEKRLLNGHLWIYSNEIDSQASPLSGFAPGERVSIISHQGKCLGNGYINPHTLLCARLLTRNPAETIDVDFFREKIQKALRQRSSWFKKPFYRLIYGESDGLPGVVVDRFGDYLVVQINTAGMENLKEIFLSSLQQEISPRGILWKNDSASRKLENLPLYVESAFGNFPEEITLEENGITFVISPHKGQKTGWFYDHRDNRQLLINFVSGRRVLDVFSYVGGWAIQAACFGAKEIWALDSSAAALKQLEHNAKLNKVESKIKTFEADAFTQLKHWHETGQQFDVVIIDPPAFIKKRKDHAEGLAAYKKLNGLAIQLLAKGGYLISASCSHHLTADELQECVLSGSLKSKKEIQILKRGHQGVDHPIHPAIPETEYLKCLTCRVVL